MQRDICTNSNALASLMRHHRLVDNLDNIIDRMLDKGCSIIVCPVIADCLSRLHKLPRIFSSYSASRLTLRVLIPYINRRHLRSL